MTDYYHDHCQAYFEETVPVDPEPFLGPFVRHLTPGCRVLDAGCGSGRDLRWLRDKGFEVIGLDRSPGLLALARKHSGCRVIEGDFETFDFSRLAVDAALLCGSLVHVPHDRLKAVLLNVIRAIRADRSGQSGDAGRMYVSLKEGRGRFTGERGRIFYLWQDDRLRALFAACGLSVLECMRSLSADGEGKVWLGYVLSVAVRGCRPPVGL